MATYYVDPINGNDSSAGTSWSTAVKTLTVGLTKVAAVNSTIFLAPGTYYEGTIRLSVSDNGNLYGTKIIGIGDVLFNASGHDYLFYVNTSSNGSYTFSVQNIKCTGWHKYAMYTQENGTTVFINCIFYQTGSKFQTTQLFVNYTYNNTLMYIRCTIFGINQNIYTCTNGVSNYLLNCITYKNLNLGTNGMSIYGPAYNASETASIYSTSGFGTATYPPPFTSDSTTAPNFTFDTGATHYTKYMTSGINAGGIGAMHPACTWRSLFDEATAMGRFAQMTEMQGLGSATSIYGQWVNDLGWFDPSFSPIVISGSANKINFREVAGGAERTATLADGTYASGAAMATQVATALNTAPSKTATYTVNYAATSMLLQIKSDGSHLDLMWATGTDTANTAATKLGFAVADNTGNTQYSAINGLYKGPQGSAPSDAALVKYLSASNVMTLDYDLCPNGKHGRIVGPVVDMVVETKPNKINVGALVSGSANISDIQIRANPSVFLYTAAAGTTELDWTAIAEDTNWSGTNKYRYWQIRMNLNLE